MKIRNILGSVAVIAVVAALGYVGTSAYFSDTETSEGNVLAAGTIDIAVDDQNPWTETYLTKELRDLKPGGHEVTMTFVVKNVGENPANIWKRLTNTVYTTGIVSEPECDDQEGIYHPSEGDVAAWCDGTDNNDLGPYLNYSMVVGETTLIDPSWEVKLGDLEGVWVPIATLAKGETVTVIQTYQLDADAGNEFQGDELTFDVELYAEQMMATGPVSDAKGLVLENKDTEHWLPMIDNIWGLLTWDDSGNYRIRAWNLQGTTYKLQAWDAANEVEYAMFGVTYGGGNIDDATQSYTGLNSHENAKYGLKETTTWSQALSLYEANQVNVTP